MKITDAELKEQVIAATKALDNAQAKSLDAAKALGSLLIEAQKRHKTTKAFEAFLKDAGGVKLSRAYELIGLAAGRIDEAKLRADKAERVRKSREKKKAEAAKSIPLRSGKPEPEPKVVPLHSTGDKPQDASTKALADFKFACNTYLPRMNLKDAQAAGSYFTDIWTKTTKEEKAS
jgi:hypothetical protein